jgi:uncharacterized protein YndB with AHSA1/START domain
MVTTQDQQQTSLRVERSTQISASIQEVFDSLVEQLGPACEMPDGSPKPMTFEAWPGGRWFRDLGQKSGHLWGQVQVIKPPSLIEINGPLFMSYPVVSHLQYRLTEQEGQTTIQFSHRAFGEIEPSHLENVENGWIYQLETIKERAEQAKS